MTDIPKVGIFFFVYDKLLAAAVPTSEGEEYGDAIQFGGHYEFWESLSPKNLQERKFKSRAYDACPRGRVVYFPKTKIYRIYHDRCLRKGGRELKMVIEGFGLTHVEKEFELDEHYRCSTCNPYFLD